MKTLLEQLIYFGFFQATLLLTIFLFSSRSKKRFHPYLAILISAVYLGLIGKTIYLSEVFEKDFRWNAMGELSACWFGPSLYLFYEGILKRKTFKKVDLLHYLPGLFYFLFIIFYFFIPDIETIRENFKTGQAQRVITFLHATGLAINITYLLKTFPLLSQFDSKMKSEISFHIQNRFLKSFLGVICLCYFVWLTFFISTFFGYEGVERQIRDYMWSLVVLFVLFLSFYIVAFPNVLNILPIEITKKYINSRLTNDDLDELKLKLENLMESKKPYLNKKLVKAELANEIGINNPDMARLLNERIGMTFFEFVNYYRIMEFIKLAKTEKGKQLTFFGLAQEVGFNSKTTFNSAFKNLLGMSPSQYFKN